MHTVCMAKSAEAVLEVAGRAVAITNPGKIFLPKAGHTKLDLAKYDAAVDLQCPSGANRGRSSCATPRVAPSRQTAH